MQNPVSFFKAIADETRLKMILLIQQHGELCVCELVSALALSQPKISRHLAQLRKAQLLVDRKQKQWVYYRINPQLEPWCLSVLDNTLSSNHSYISQQNTDLEAMGDRPTREAQCCDTQTDSQ